MEFDYFVGSVDEVASWHELGRDSIMCILDGSDPICELLGHTRAVRLPDISRIETLGEI